MALPTRDTLQDPFPFFPLLFLTEHEDSSQLGGTAGQLLNHLVAVASNLINPESIIKAEVAAGSRPWSLAEDRLTDIVDHASGHLAAKTLTYFMGMGQNLKPQSTM